MTQHMIRPACQWSADVLRRARVFLALALLVVAMCAPILQAAPPLPAERMVVVAVADRPDPVATAGSTPRGYGGLPNYTGGERTLALATKVADDHRLREVSAWTIEPLHLRCMLYELPEGAARDEVLAGLNADARVRLAQPLQEFSTLTLPDNVQQSSTAATSTYNDPYVGLQRGFAAIGAGAAHRYANGEGVRVAVVDTGIDAAHPDLAGRIAEQRDFVSAPMQAAVVERHGTEVAGVIAAVANNRVGIVGVAPYAQLLSYRACWGMPDRQGARCDTYTLALALGAAISSGADILNLSLGGPSDPLLGQLASYAVDSGMIVVGAVPPDGRMDGFPLGVPGVIAVRGNDEPLPRGPALAAPSLDILTLEPGGHYDYASGSSLAAAHVSGALALLLQLKPRLDADQLIVLLQRSGAIANAPIDACAAARSLSGNTEACAEPASIHPSVGGR
jgi:subtilisin family serine protease